LVLASQVDARLARVQTPDVVAVGGQQKCVVAAAAAGYQGSELADGASGVPQRVSAGVVLLGRWHEVRALANEVGEGEGGAGPVPGMEGVDVEVVPTGSVSEEGGVKGLSETRRHIRRRHGEDGRRGVGRR
jgi:hypothetical protein